MNSAFEELAPALSCDGHCLFFTRDRPGGLGFNDIWVARRSDVHDDAAWNEPVNVGPAVNTAAADVMGSFLERDGRRLLRTDRARAGTEQRRG